MKLNQWHHELLGAVAAAASDAVAAVTGNKLVYKPPPMYRGWFCIYELRWHVIDKISQRRYGLARKKVNINHKRKGLVCYGNTNINSTA